MSRPAPALSQCERCMSDDHISTRLPSGRLTSLLNSNVPPLEPERLVLEECVSEDGQMLANLNQEIVALRETLANLTRRKDTTEHRLSHYKSVLNPIRRLPPEILRRVFLHASMQNTEFVEYIVGPGSNSFDPHGTVWRISHVCSRWRTISLGYPRLWATVRLVYCPETIQTLPERKWNQLLGIQIHRAGIQPLSVMVGDSKTHHLPSLPATIFETLLSSASRWVDLAVDVRRDSLQTMRDIPMFLNNLERLFLRFHSGGTYYDVRIPVLMNTLKYATKLRTLISSPTVLAHVHMTLLHLRTFQYRYTTGEKRPCGIDDWLWILQNVPNLDKATILSRVGYSPGGRPGASPIHQKLRELMIEEASSDGSSTLFLDHVTLPGLRKLTLYGKPDMLKIHNFLEESDLVDKLEELHFESVQEELVDFAEMIPPSVQKLTLVCPGQQPDHFVSHLATNKQDFPLLKELRVSSTLPLPESLMRARPDLAVTVM